MTVEITSDTTTSSLSGGNSAETYLISNGASLLVDSNFQCQNVSVGLDGSSNEEIGFIQCSSGYEFKLNNNGVFSIYSFGEVKDRAAPSHTKPVSPQIFKPLVSTYKWFLASYRPTAKWTVKYYFLDKPQVTFRIYDTLWPEGSSDTLIQFNAWFDTLSIKEDMGGSRYEIQKRYGKRPRFSAIGLEGREVNIECAFDSLTDWETGYWRYLTRMADDEVLGCLTTTTNIFPRMRIVDTGNIERRWERNNFRYLFNVTFIEDEE